MEIEKNRAERIVAWIEDSWRTLAGIFSFLNAGPLGWVARRIRGLWRWYKRAIWDRYARNKEGRITQKRAATTFAATLLVLWVLPSVIGATLQGGLMALTMKREQVYLTQSEEIDPDNEVFNVRGNTKPVSTPENALYYRVRPTLAHQLHSYAVYHTPFYAEDIASIAPGLNRCEVVSYGFRMRMLVRGWGIYPDMLWSSCTPVEAPKDGEEG